LIALLPAWLSCRSKTPVAEPAPAIVSLAETAAKMGDEVHVRVEKAPPVWSGSIVVDGLHSFRIDPRQLSARITTDNGFTHPGVHELYATLVDSKGIELPVKQGRLLLEVTEPNVRVSIGDEGQKFRPGGDSGSFAVIARDGTRWSVGGVPDWIRIVSGANGSGNGSVTFTVAPNLTNEIRSANLTVEDATVILSQLREPRVRIPFHAPFRSPLPVAPKWAFSTTSEPPDAQYPSAWFWHEFALPSSVVSVRPEGPGGSPSLVVERKKPAAQDYASQAVLPHIDVQPGARYLVSARMKTENPAPVGFVLMQVTPPYHACGLFWVFNVTSSWQQYTAAFEASREDNCDSPNNMLGIMTGHIQGKLWVTDFSVERAH
jgi:hypothetical protein